MKKMIDIDFGTNRCDELAELRYKVLLEPLGLKFLEHYREKEIGDIHIGCVESLDDKLVGGLLMIPLDNHEIRIMQVAVLPKYQREGVGHKMIDYAISKARAAGYSKLVMHAMLSVVHFYETLGFKAEGDVFEENGITFVKMIKMI